MPAPNPVAIRARPGRPRKVTHERVIAAALVVMEREGFAALSLRALAQELGLSHSNLYNYVRDIGDVEAEVLQRLVAGLTTPTASAAPKLKEELLTFLRSVRTLIARHPQVIHPPIGSKAWRSLTALTQTWVEALGRFEPPRDSMVGFAALVSYVGNVAARDRAYGPSHIARSIRELNKSFPDMARALAGATDDVTATLELIMERMLPRFWSAARKPRASR